MEYKAFVSAAWTEFTNKCSALFPFLKKTWQGTRAEWDLLSSADKAHYDIVNFTDDTADGGAVVVDEVTAGNLNAVTSNAVANALAPIGTIVTESLTATTVATTWTPFSNGVSLSKGTWVITVMGKSSQVNLAYIVASTPTGWCTVPGSNNPNASVAVYSGVLALAADTTVIFQYYVEAADIAIELAIKAVRIKD